MGDDYIVVVEVSLSPKEIAEIQVLADTNNCSFDETCSCMLKATLELIK